MDAENELEGWKRGGGHPRGWMVYEEYLFDLSAENAAVDTLQTELFEPGFIYKITSISAVDVTTQVSSSLAIGYVSGGLFKILKAEKPTAGLTVSWQGEIYLYEGSRVRAVFTNTTQNDDIFLVVNGLKLPIRG